MERERERESTYMRVRYIYVTQRASHAALCVYLIIIITTSQSYTYSIPWQPSTLLIRTANCGARSTWRYEIIDVFRYTYSDTIRLIPVITIVITIIIKRGKNVRDNVFSSPSDYLSIVIHASILCYSLSLYKHRSYRPNKVASGYLGLYTIV